MESEGGLEVCQVPQAEGHGALAVLPVLDGAQLHVEHLAEHGLRVPKAGAQGFDFSGGGVVVVEGFHARIVSHEIRVYFTL